jgi:hypothetical protein
VKPIADNARLGERARKGEELGEPALRSVEAGIETGDLWQAGRRCIDCADRRQIVRLVERGQGHKGFKLNEERLGHPGWAGLVTAAMHHPMTGRGDRDAVQIGFQPVQKRGDEIVTSLGGIKQHEIIIPNGAAFAILRRENGAFPDPGYLASQDQ